MNVLFIDSIVNIAVKIRIDFSSVCKLDLFSALLLFIDSVQVKDQMPAFESYLEEALIELRGYSMHFFLDAVVAVPSHSLHAALL